MTKRLMAGALLATLAWAIEPSADLKRATNLYQETRFDEAIHLLTRVGSSDPKSLQLLGQSYFMVEEYKKATETLERAVAAEPRNSEHQLWLGRAWGRRAETSSFVTAPGYAAKARQHFEKAFEYDQSNMDAVSDLFSFYLEAPGFLGGGLDKAETLAQWIQKLDPAEYQFAEAMLSEKRKEFQKTEQHLKQAINLAPRQVGRVLDLAKFFARQGRVPESEAAFARAQEIDPNSPKVLYERASVYVKSKRNLDVARDLLRKYLDSQLTPDDPTRREAQRKLRQAVGS
jgi:tetratricopeptide (TPR) repeat protein